MTTLDHSTVQRGKDCFEDCVPLAGHFVIPEAEECVAGCVEPMGSCFVRRTFGVVEAVDFDDKMPVAKNEIDDIDSQWYLPRELEAVEAAVAKVTPEKTLFCRLYPS